MADFRELVQNLQALLNYSIITEADLTQQCVWILYNNQEVEDDDGPSTSYRSLPLYQSSDYSNLGHTEQEATSTVEYQQEADTPDEEVLDIFGRIEGIHGADIGTRQNGVIDDEECSPSFSPLTVCNDSEVAYIQSSSEEDEETEKKLFQVPLLNTPSSSPTVPTVSNEERRSPIPSICPQDTDDVGTYDNLHIYWTRRNELQARKRNILSVDSLKEKVPMKKTVRRRNKGFKHQE